MTTSILLFADRPVGSDADALWEGHAIREQLEHIADTLVAPLVTGRPAPSLTVAVHGAWGSGKSSALCILRDLACAKASALPPPASAAASPPSAAASLPSAAASLPPAAARERLVFCEYSSPVWQSTHFAARTTLVARMLASLAGSVDHAVEDLFMTAKAASSALGDTPQPRDADGRLVWSSATLSQIAAVLSRLHDFEALLRRRILEGAAGPRVLVVLIDDLDRCEPACVRELLSEVQQLGGLPNIFFVLAADEGTLRRAVQESVPGRARTPLEADHELAKLVQHTVSVPDLDEAGAGRLLDRLFAGSAADPFARALTDNAGLFFQGLPEQTPRAVKRCLNSLGHRLRAELSAPGRKLTPIDVKKRLKEALLEHTWESFYRTSFVPMARSAGRDREPLVSLQGVLSRVQHGGAESPRALDRRIAHELTFLCDEFPSVPWRDLPARLVRFLGADPLLVELAPSVARPRSRPRGVPVGVSPIVLESHDDALFMPVMQVDPGAGDGPDLEPSAAPIDTSTPAGVLAAALAAARSGPDPRGRLEIAAQAVLDLAAFEPASDGAAMTLAREILPALVLSPDDGALLAAVLDRYVVLLRRCGLLRLACKALHDAYKRAGHVAYVRDAYASYLLGAGAVEAARQVNIGKPVEYREVLRDDPAGLKRFVHDDAVRELAAAATA